jgi:hypothetical protein
MYRLFLQLPCVVLLAAVLHFRVLCLPAVFFFNILLGIQFGTVAQHLKKVQQGGIKL